MPTLTEQIKECKEGQDTFREKHNEMYLCSLEEKYLCSFQGSKVYLPKYIKSHLNMDKYYMCRRK